MKKNSQIKTGNRNIQNKRGLYNQFKEYFKIGVSGEYILLREDFPIGNISPADFSRLCIEVFKRNDEAFRRG